VVGEVPAIAGLRRVARKELLESADPDIVVGGTRGWRGGGYPLIPPEPLTPGAAIGQAEHPAPEPWGDRDLDLGCGERDCLGHAAGR